MKRTFSLILALLALATAIPASSAEAKPDFARWENEIAAFEKSDATNPPPQGAILFAGSSTIRMWTTLAQDFPGHRIINRGFGGSQIADSTHFAKRIIFPYAPRAIFFRAGGNDLADGKSPEQVFADFKEFVATIHATLPETEITYLAWNPTLARRSQRDKEHALNELVRTFASRTPRVKYIDTESVSLDAEGHVRAELLLPDKLHFNAEGYKRLAEAVRPHLPKEVESSKAK